MTRAILTLNSGSSSLKLGLFTEDLGTMAMCHVDRIGRRSLAGAPPFVCGSCAEGGARAPLPE